MTHALEDRPLVLVGICRPKIANMNRVSTPASLDSLVSNGNRTEWSPIRSVIIQVITKSDDRSAD